MQTRIIRVVDDPQETKRGLVGWVRTHPNSGFVLGFVGAAVPGGPLWILGGAAIGAGVGRGATWLLGKDTSKDISLAEAKRYRDHHGAPLQKQHYYAAHPLKERHNVFLPAAQFHQTIVSEQIADLTGFLRSAVALRSLTIDVFSEKTGRLQGGGSVGEIGIAGGAQSGHTFAAVWDHPERIPLTRTLLWIDRFPEIESAVEGASSGRLKRTVFADTSFGISAKLGKTVGIASDWLANQRFEITAEYV